MRRPLVVFAAAAALAACGSSSDRSSGAAAAPSCPIAVREPVLPPEMVRDLGTLPVGAEATFDVPPGIASFFIFSQESGNSAPETVSIAGVGSVPNAVVPTDLRGPDQTLYYDDLLDWPSTVIDAVEYPDVSSLLAYNFG